MEDNNKANYSIVGVDMGYASVKSSHIALQEDVEVAVQGLSEIELQEVLNYIEFVKYKNSKSDMSTGENEFLYPEQSE